MYTSDRRCWAAVLCLFFALSVGCSQTHDCEREESCNYADDDCDGLVDEGFRNEDGAYATGSHCGACDLSCDEVFPTASATECVEQGAEYRCQLLDCPVGQHPSGEGACVPDVNVGCLPCATDEDCERFQPGTVCIGDSLGGHCFQPCGAGCPEGYDCAGLEGQELCFPLGGDCICNEETLGAEYACLLLSSTGDQCVGEQNCGPDGVTSCEAALDELCNGVDEDCDGFIDEGFLIDGIYQSPDHCGECGVACAPPGPNMTAECIVVSASASCELDCVDGFVDVDGILANGCECERSADTDAPIGIDTDSDCDGVVDDSDEFVFVTSAGNDRDPGTLARPMRSLTAAIARAESLGRDVLVARGVYEGVVTLREGVSVFGGYRPDFRERDLDLYPVRLEARLALGGEPVVRAVGIREATVFAGFEIIANDAVAVGGGTSAVYLDECGPELNLLQVLVISGEGADGVRGASSVDALRLLGVTSLGELDGTSGAEGLRGTAGGACRGIVGGAGGVKSCFGASVAGGRGAASGCPELSCTQSRACGNAGCTDFTTDGMCDLAAVLAAAVPNPEGEPGRGVAGGAAGEATYDSPTNRGECFFCDDSAALPRTGVDGLDGADGIDGMGGLGCAADAVFDTARGVLRGGPGSEGTGGSAGSGGGGGSSGSGYAVIGGTVGMCESQAGGSGGGGGSGGCGAPGAEGGTGGGASVGIAIRLAAGLSRGPSLDDVDVVTASGGRGGDGGSGANGGGAGNGAAGGPGNHWCSRIGGRGGNGGRGGAAGGGGGGCGGDVYGVYIHGATTGSADYLSTLRAAVTVREAGLPGAGGRGGFAPRASGADGGNGLMVPVGSGL